MNQGLVAKAVDEQHLRGMEARALSLVAVQLRELGVMLPEESCVGAEFLRWSSLLHLSAAQRVPAAESPALRLVLAAE